MKVLVIAEHNNKDLKPSTLNTISAGLKIHSAVDVFVAGRECGEVVEQLKNVAGIKDILWVDDPKFEHPMAEGWAEYLKPLAATYTHVLAPASTFGKNLLPRLAALLDVGQISDVISVESSDTFKRPIYAGNAIATVQSFDPIKMLTIRTTVFDAATMGGGKAQVESLDVSEILSLSRFIEMKSNLSNRPELTSAKVIVSGGRGLQSKENFKLIEDLAVTLNAAIGASRAAVDAGYVPNDYQIGQTGKVVAPDLYIAVGISGAIQHVAGMKDSKVIVAINKDEEAPIFQIADYGVVGDLFDIVPKLTDQLANRSK